MSVKHLRRFAAEMHKKQIECTFASYVLHFFVIFHVTCLSDIRAGMVGFSPVQIGYS